MDTTAIITLVIGFAFFPVALLWVYKEAGSLANKFAISFSVATIISLLPIIFMATSEDFSATLVATGNIGVPPFILIFSAQLIVFAVLTWKWYGLIRRVHSFRSKARELQRNITAAVQKIETISKEIEDKGKTIQTVNGNITDRYIELEEIRKTPR